MSITLHGFSHSNYYNKVKLALLEKGVPFTEEYAATHSHEEAVLNASPLGKIPYLTTEQGTVCESQALLEYIEARWPEPPLLPADAFAAAKVRELAVFIDWHLEIVARRLYGSTFFGAPALPEEERTEIRKKLAENIAGFKRLAKFSPYVAGDSFTMADCAAFNNLPVIGLVTKAAFGEDMLLAAGIDYKPYMKLVGERATAQKLVADRKAAQASLK